MKSLTALETLRGRQHPQAASDEQFFYDRQAYDEEDAFFDAEIAREGCLTPENCEIHNWARCGQQRPEVLRALSNERQRRSDPQGYAESEAAKQACKERRAAERRGKALARKAQRKAEKERRHTQAIADQLAAQN